MSGSAGCTDVDDALSVRQLGAGRLEVGVHIADVSHFVRQVSSHPLLLVARHLIAQIA